MRRAAWVWKPAPATGSSISVNGHLPKPSGIEQDLKGRRKAGYGRRNTMDRELEPGLHGYPCPWASLPGFFQLPILHLVSLEICFFLSVTCFNT